MYHEIFLGRLSLLGRPGRPKVVSIKIFTVSRDRFGLSDRDFSIQAIAVVPVFFDRPRSSVWCFHIIVPVAVDAIWRDRSDRDDYMETRL